MRGKGTKCKRIGVESKGKARKVEDMKRKEEEQRGEEKSGPERTKERSREEW